MSTINQVLRFPPELKPTRLISWSPENYASALAGNAIGEVRTAYSTIGGDAQMKLKFELMDSEQVALFYDHWQRCYGIATAWIIPDGHCIWALLPRSFKLVNLSWRFSNIPEMVLTVIDPECGPLYSCEMDLLSVADQVNLL